MENFNLSTKEMLDTKDSYLARKILLIFITISGIVSLFAFAYCLKNGLILLYADSYFHLNIARRVIDGITPGLVQLGTVWLPIPHITMLPFVWSDLLWRTGIAGSIPSMIAFIFSSYLIFLILKKLTESLFISFFAGLLFVLNPNILYLQSIPMTEIIFILTALSSIYFLILWVKEFHRIYKIKWLIFSSIFAFLGSLVRYEGWFLILAEVLVILYVYVFIYRKDRNNVDLKMLEGDSLIFLFPATLGVITWFFYNWVIFGNPLEFLSGKYSAYYQQLSFLEQGKLFTKGNLHSSVESIVWSVIDNSGYVLIVALLIFSCIALPVFLRRFFLLRKITRNGQLLILSLFLLFSPAIFQVYSLYEGNTILYVSEVFPTERIFNVRYGILVFPGVVIALGIIVSLLRGSRFLLIPLIGIQLLVFLMGYQSVSSFDDGKYGMSSANKSSDAKECWEYLTMLRKEHELVLASSLVNDIYIPNYKIQFKNIIHEGSYKYWQESLSNPAQYATWILMQEDDFDPIYQLRNNPDLEQKFYKDKQCNNWSVWHIK